MLWWKCNPFAPSEDPLEFMLSILVREAESRGVVLSNEDLDLLRKHRERDEELPNELRQRLDPLIVSIIYREEESGDVENPRSFTGAIEWAGYDCYPLVVELAEEIISRQELPGPRILHKSWWKDRIALLGCSLVFIIVMGLLSALLGFLGL